EGASIMIAPYPTASRRELDTAAERDMAVVMGAVSAIRAIRGEMRVSPAITLAVTAKTAGADTALLREHAPLVQSLARATLTVDPRATRPRASALGVVGGTEVYVALEGVVDLAAERQRLEKEIKRAEEAIAFGRAKLSRSELAERAPAAAGHAGTAGRVVAGQRAGRRGCARACGVAERAPEVAHRRPGRRPEDRRQPAREPHAGRGCRGARGWARRDRRRHRHQPRSA